MRFEGSERLERVGPTLDGAAFSEVVSLVFAAVRDFPEARVALESALRGYFVVEEGGDG